jgi:DNA-binding CsgD family transcriptional regulator
VRPASEPDGRCTGVWAGPPDNPHTVRSNRSRPDRSGRAAAPRRDRTTSHWPSGLHYRRRVSALLADTAPVRLVGRDRELDRVAELVDAAGRGARFVVIRGEAGIGKTSLWRWGAQRHAMAGHRVLVTRASEEELHGPIVGLVDLFEHTTEGADALTPDLDRYERGRRVLATLRRLAADAPVVVAIDDVNWLDPVSAGALRYAFRRLASEPVVVLATERLEPSAPPDARTIPVDRREEIFLGPLTFEATREVTSSVTDAIPRTTLDRIHTLSGGNPMYAIELARAVDLFADPLEASLPPTLLGVLSNRLVGLHDDVLAVLRAAAGLGPSSAAAISRAVGVKDASPSIATAIARGLLVVGSELLVRFAHPMVASAVLATLDPLARQDLHARLADLADDPDARARHLALSCADPDADVAGELEAAATRAARRGASSLAAEFAAHSLRLTPPGDLEMRIRRAFAAVLHRAAAGDKAQALADADRLVATLPPGAVRAEAIALRVALDFDGGDGFLEKALAEVGDDDSLRGRLLELRGWLALVHRADLQRGEELASEALVIARRLDDPALEMLAAATTASASLLLGQPRDDLMARALELATRLEGPRLGRLPQGVHGRHCLWCGRLPEARKILEELYTACVQGGLEFQRPFRILDLAHVEIASGNLLRAAELADEGVEAASDSGNPQAEAWLAYPVGLASAHLGNTDRAIDAAALLRSRVAEQDGRPRLVMAGHVLGVLALATGSPAKAVAVLEPALDLAREIGARLPSVVPVLPEAIEAAALAGQAEACAALASELDSQATDVKQPWVDAAARRGRGLAALAAGSDEAIDLLDSAAREFDELGYRVDAARTLIVQGRALRRAGRRNVSADVLAEAHRRLAAMGAAPWLAQVDAELERVAPGREQAELTPTEARIAELVAAGRRNREIAGELFISVATVEAHLTRIYRKLHVRSRTELARVLR